MNTTKIEMLLRHAPKPEPPTGLKEKLIAQIDLAEKNANRLGQSNWRDKNWVRRWWPAFAPATLSLACAAVFTLQQVEIQQLKQAIQSLPQTAPTTGAGSHSPEQPQAASSETQIGTELSSEEREIARLKELAARLTSQVEQLERLRAENVKLRTQLAATPGNFSAEELESMSQAKERAMAIACVNNMKQLGLAVRIWSLDNEERTPSDLLSMTNELSTPKVLLCPADQGRQVAPDWAGYTSANCSYEYLAPASLHADREPQRVMFRCPIHGSVTLSDGSVQMAIAKKHPDWLVERDGKLYFEAKPEPNGTN